MGRFILGVMLGASVMGVGVWATDRNLGVVSDAVIHLDSLNDTETLIPAANILMAECMYYKDGVWDRLTPESIK